MPGNFPRHILEQIKQIIPPLNGKLHKGQSGRVGVLGGALDYTGAPFFAAMSAQRLGADLSHVICSPSAAGAIKSYSPDLIVHPILREDTPPEKLRPELTSLLQRLHVLIVGPGLGREPYMQTFAKLAISLAKDQKMYLVLDADALLLVGQDTNLVKGYVRAVLTPNVVEFKRLTEALKLDPSIPPQNLASALSESLNGVTILQKGPSDTIATNSSSNPNFPPHTPSSTNNTSPPTNEVITVSTPGGLKRCGGQGDVLSGAVGTFLAWGKCYEDGAFGQGTPAEDSGGVKKDKVPLSRIPLLAAAAGSYVTRTASRRTFEVKRRSMVTQDMLSNVGPAFEECFEDGAGKDGTKL